MDEYRLLFFSSLNARNKDILRNLMVVTFSLNISYSVHQNIFKWKKGKFSQGATMLTSTGFSSRIPGNLKLLQLAAAVADKITLLELRSSTAQFSSFSEASSCSSRGLKINKYRLLVGTADSCNSHQPYPRHIFLLNRSIAAQMQLPRLQRIFCNIPESQPTQKRREMQQIIHLWELCFGINCRYVSSYEVWLLSSAKNMKGHCIAPTCLKDFIFCTFWALWSILLGQWANWIYSCRISPLAIKHQCTDNWSNGAFRQPGYSGHMETFFWQ